MILQFLKSKVAVFHLIVSFKANRVLHNLFWVWSLLVTMYSLRFFHFVETICASAFVRAMLGGAGSSMLRMASPTCASSELCFPFLGFNKIAFVIRQEEAHMQQGMAMQNQCMACSGHYSSKDMQMFDSPCTVSINC